MKTSLSATLKQFVNVELGEIFLFASPDGPALGIGVVGGHKGKYTGLFKFTRNGVTFPAFVHFDNSSYVLSLGKDFYIHYTADNICAPNSSKTDHPLYIGQDGSISVRFNPLDYSLGYDSQNYDLQTGLPVTAHNAWLVDKWAIWTSEDAFKAEEPPIFSSTSLETAKTP